MLNQQQYQQRRQQLMSQLDDDSVVIVASGRETLRTGDVNYPFRANSDFYYLTGFDEPDAIAVLVPGRKEGEYVLFNRENDPTMEIWYGHRAGQEGAVKEFQADEAFAKSKFAELLPDLLQGRRKIYYQVGLCSEFDKRIMTVVNQLKAKVRAGSTWPQEFHDVARYMHEMRLIKSPQELDLLRKVGKISAQAHIRAMQACKPGMYEYQLHAELMYEFMNNGAKAESYPSIVGSGANGCVLHYIENNHQINDGDLVLIDAGAEYYGYASDITRTFPANGCFTNEQKAIYEVVLATQLECIAMAAPGVHYDAVEDKAIELISQGLIDLGIIKENLSTTLEEKLYRTFYMHRVGHWLGLDTHDAGQYKQEGDWRTLQANMVRTIEPGIYISPGTEGVDEKWWGIAVRVEDDIIITDDGCEPYTTDAPKTIEDIEHCMG